MKINAWILYQLAKRWPSPIKRNLESRGEDFKNDEYHLKYALQEQYLYKVKGGFPYDIYDKEVLEIGCGHGGNTVFFAVNGAKRTVGIDLNTHDLGIARKFLAKVEQKLRVPDAGLNCRFIEMNAYDMQFEPESFDVVIADNVFEHFMEPGKVMEQAHKILRKGGILIVSNFNSIFSKYGLHLKYGLKLPWANVFFSEKTICNVMLRLAQDNEKIFDAYPGLKSTSAPTKVKDLRAYGDLNSITHKRFLKLAEENNFHVKTMIINPAPKNVLLKDLFRIFYKIPFLKYSLLGDIFSVSARSVLVKK